MTALDEQVGGSHYKDLAIQPIEFILENNLSFPEGCVVKYICRHKSKGGRLDLEKAKQCIDFIIEHDYPDCHKDEVAYSSGMEYSGCLMCLDTYKGVHSSLCKCLCHQETINEQ